jgi:hypothetical protein
MNIFPVGANLGFAQENGANIKFATFFCMSAAALPGPQGKTVTE